MKTHEYWMRLALQMAHATLGQTTPNPSVGAVIVKNGALVGLGAHLKAGTSHAESYALQMAGKKASDSSLYVTLEPCAHRGQTPSCTSQIIESGIRTVYVGAIDPDKRVCGKGIRELRMKGIEVVEGILSQECSLINEAYFYHRSNGRPFVTLKTATTLDGKIATKSGDSKWITGEESRAYVHELRHQHDAIVVGIETVLADNPLLTTRLDSGKGLNPIRIILDSKLRIPLDAAILKDTVAAPTWIFTTDQKDLGKEGKLLEKGIDVISTGNNSLVDIDTVLSVLGDRGILSVLVEGGGEVNAAFLRGGYVQKVISFIASKILGGKDSYSSVKGQNPEFLYEAIQLKDIELRTFGDDLCYVGYI